MDLVFDAPQVVSLLGGFLALFFLLELLRSSLKSRPRVFLAVNLFLFVLYLVLGFYHHHTRQSFDFALIVDNWKLLLGGTAWGNVGDLAGAIFQPQDYRFSLVVLVIFAFFLRKDLRAFPRMKIWPGSLSLGLCLLVATVNLFLLDYTTDEFSNLAASVRARLIDRQNFIQRQYVVRSKEIFPFMRDIGLAGQGAKAPPNILLVLVESFNANFVEVRSASGREITPVYNRLIRQGRYYEQFYGAAVQTSDGQFAALCGLLPRFRGKAMTNDPDKSFLCAPEVLRRQGYRTFFSHAYPHPTFDNTQGFLTKNGIEEMRLFSDCQGADQKLCWGWGLADDVFFQRAVGYLSKTMRPGHPFLAVLSTISSHMSFEDVPPDFRLINENPVSRRDHYENAIHYADRALGILMEEIKTSPFAGNTVVLITGDHSFPLGEHGNFHNENYAYEESYRTPMLILDLRKSPREERLGGRYSQLGIPATLLDLAGLKKVHAPFLLDSLYLPPPKMTYHIQPYAGTYLAVAQDGLKYIFWEGRRKEFLYDLKNDPLESLNVIDQYRGTEILEQLRAGIGRIYQNQDLIRMDRIWPQEPPPPASRRN
ncbi:MAG: LTA synthase family protein [Bdellovibrionaceae bacterium]|nr:LTA synthase family protein [Pseudobdellovibrionaceae bacterium]